MWEDVQIVLLWWGEGGGELNKLLSHHGTLRTPDFHLPQTYRSSNQSLVIFCLGLQEEEEEEEEEEDRGGWAEEQEEPKIAHPVSLTWASHTAISLVTGR